MTGAARGLMWAHVGELIRTAWRIRRMLHVGVTVSITQKWARPHKVTESVGALKRDGDGPVPNVSQNGSPHDVTRR